MSSVSEILIVIFTYAIRHNWNRSIYESWLRTRIKSHNRFCHYPFSVRTRRAFSAPAPLRPQEGWVLASHSLLSHGPCPAAPTHGPTAWHSLNRALAPGAEAGLVPPATLLLARVVGWDLAAGPTHLPWGAPSAPAHGEQSSLAVPWQK